MRSTRSIATILALSTLLCTAIATAEESNLNTLTPQESQEGFTLLFDGKTLDGWRGDLKGYAVIDGAMVCKPGGDIYAAKDYANFILRFEFKLPTAGNNGVSVRTPIDAKLPSAYSGIEIQILDDADPSYKDLHDYQCHGSLYGVMAAKRGALKPIGQWNSEEIIADGSRFKVTVNGVVVLDTDIAGIKETVDGRPHPGLHNASGALGWAGHGPDVSFRNVRIKELP